MLEPIIEDILAALLWLLACLVGIAVWGDGAWKKRKTILNKRKEVDPCSSLPPGRKSSIT